ncbi:hypothetical protein pb186bvf_019519 [Paramecium bursaria]
MKQLDHLRKQTPSKGVNDALFSLKIQLLSEIQNDKKSTLNTIVNPDKVEEEIEDLEDKLLLVRKNYIRAKPQEQKQKGDKMLKILKKIIQLLSQLDQYYKNQNNELDDKIHKQFHQIELQKIMSLAKQTTNQFEVQYNFAEQSMIFDVQF